MKYNWKKYYRDFPDRISQKLDELGGSSICVFSVKLLATDDIKKGLYKHLGIVFKGENLVFPNEVIPNVIGGFTKYNVEDREIIRKDLPKESYTVTVEAPNWGDDYNGTHEVTWSKERYRREIQPARGYSISIKQVKLDSTLFEFVVTNSFSSKSREEIFYAINLLQETTGSSDVRNATEVVDYSRLQQVDWEIFPPEKREDFVCRVMSGVNTENDQKKTEAVQERLSFLQSLRPVRYIYGVTGLGNYMGAMLFDDLVVFENQNYGNAVYILYKEWKTLSKLSRTELLKLKSGEYDRVVHRNGWQDEVKKIVKQKFSEK